MAICPTANLQFIASAIGFRDDIGPDDDLKMSSDLTNFEVATTTTKAQTFGF